MKKSNLRRWSHLFFISFFAGIYFLIACQKADELNTDPNLQLQFSNDSVVFDTVFSTIGSISKQLRVYNNSNKKVNISAIRLVGGESSQYRINVDGSPGLIHENIEIAANDSIFIFVRVTINPTLEDAPFIVADQIEFITNGNEQNIELVAWGQNANYIVGNQLTTEGKSFRIVAAKNEDITWNSPKPYVVYGIAKVDINAVLRLPEGCRVYFHNQSGIWVAQDGCIKITGTLQNPVMLKGDRLDEGYRDLPGQWDGIILEESDQDTEINYAIIENAVNGIQAKTLEDAKSNQLIITNTIIRNMTEFGIISRAFSIQSNNTLIVNCGNRLLDIQQGGIFDFKHCTFANYWTRSFRLNPSIRLSNSFATEQEIHSNDLAASFGNCIIDGRNQEEIEFDNQTGADFNTLFIYCSLKTQDDITSSPAYDNCIGNPENIFADLESTGFKLSEESSLIDGGLLSIGQSIPFDLYGTSRLPSPDIGAIEYTPEEEKLKK